MTEISEPRADERAGVERVGDIEVERRPDGYSVTIHLNAAPPDADWIKLFDHPTDLPLVFPARRPMLSGTTIEIIVHNEEQMSASVRYAELAVTEANRSYNDEVLPRRERHRRVRDAARAADGDGLDAMARAANTL